MSRTWKDKPARLVPEEPWWRYWAFVFGAGSVHYSANRRERSARRRAKEALRKEQEPEPYRPRNNEKYHSW